MPSDAVVSDVVRSQEFPRRLLEWYRRNLRALPWRETKNPYAIYVSEMMLQQTQVATVIPYWTRWMERFPTIQTLADAPLEDVLKQWQGLGYYARARNMRRAAQIMVERHSGVFPTDFDAVLALPGIGRYTAGAICSIAYNQPVPLVDANVIRVFCRYFGIYGDPKSATVQDDLWKRAEALIPIGAASEFNQAMMELGALICIKKPRCGACPLNETCAAFAAGDPESLPQFAPKPEFTSQTDVCAVIPHPSDTERILLVRRPEGGLWGGLWELPRLTLQDSENPVAGAERAARERAGLLVRAADTVIAKLRHGVTTRKILLLALPCELVSPPEPVVEEGDAFAWLTPAETERYPLSSPQALLMTKLATNDAQLSLF